MLFIPLLIFSTSALAVLIPSSASSSSLSSSSCTLPDSSIQTTRSENLPESNTIAYRIKKSLALDSYCSQFTQPCGQGLHCVSNICSTLSTSRTPKLLTRTECTTEDSICEDFEVCLQTSPSVRECIIPLTAGEPCEDGLARSVCNPLLTCIQNRCTETLFVGSACERSSILKICESGSFCGGPEGKTTCMQTVPLGHPCGPLSSGKWFCSRGLICRFSTCVRRLKTGDDCHHDLTECSKGNICMNSKYGQTRRCIKLALNTDEVGVWVFFASRSSSIMYWNGRRVADYSSPTNFTAVKLPLEEMDVISFKVFGTERDEAWNGLIVSSIGKFQNGEGLSWIARTGDNNNRKGSRWYWRARLEDDENKKGKNWMTPNYNDGNCDDTNDGEWSQLENVDIEGRRKGEVAKYFPYWTAAKYVWLEDSDESETIHVRLRFADPSCRTR